MEDLNFNIEGLTELRNDLQRLSNKYPDRAAALLTKDARKLRSYVIKNIKKDTKPHKNKDGETSKKTLTKAKNYKISKVQDFGSHQFVDISAASPHFHLVEHGHELVINGKNRGFVQGKKMMEQAIRKYRQEMPYRVQLMVDELLAEEGFI